MKRTPSIVASMLLLIVTLALASNVLDFTVSSQFEVWVPCVPQASQVELRYSKEGDISCMNVSIEFPSSGFNISRWGTPVIVGEEITVNSEIWRWTGIDLPVITTRTHQYCLGNLPSGEYVFVFRTWEHLVKNVTFVVGSYWNPGDVDHDFDVDIFDIVKAAGAYGSTPSDPHWDPYCDVAEPYGTIDIFDIVTIASNYGKEWAGL